MITDRTIAELREKIDWLDDQLIDLLIKRFALCGRIGDSKDAIGAEFKDTDRERQIIDRIVNSVSNKLRREQIEAIFLPIFQISRNLQKKEK
ncbi:MAG: chorismate mutase [Candidatus Neomarinimicrobiota bacterium]|nr:chorismate mutase [Candidatus Neomarinimicrobiota bacterium]